MSKDRKSLGAAVGGLKKEMMQVANWYKHLKTINHHKWMVMKYCFRVGLYKQGLLHDLSKYSWTEFSVGVKNIIREIEARTMQKGRRKGIQAHGCIIKDATGIITNTGWITAWINPAHWQAARCRSNTLSRCSVTG